MRILREFVESRVRPVLENNWERRIIIGGLVVLIYLLPRLPGESVPLNLDDPQNQLFLYVGVILLYLEIIESGVSRVLTDAVSRTLYEGNSDLDDRIKEISDKDTLTEGLARRNVSTLYSIDYSGQNATELVENAMENGLTVNLLLKLPQSTLNQHQLDQMSTLLKTVNTQMKQLGGFDAEQLNIKYYWYDGVVRGRRLDDKHVFLGWYIRTSRTIESAEDESEQEQENLPDRVPEFIRYVRENNGPDGEGPATPEDWEFPADIEHPPLLANTGEKQKIWGHKIPALEFTREDEDFDEVDEVFSENLFNPLWENGISPHELYELERGLKARADQPEVYADSVFPEQSNFMIDMLENTSVTESLLKDVSPTDDEAALIER